MRARWPVLAVLAGMGAGYLGYPYATLYRLDRAMRGSDAEALTALVDWHAVREGLKEDICDMVLDETPATKASDELPAFGASFVRGVTGSMLEQTINPEAVASMTRPGADEPPPDARVSSAFFEHPTRFSFDIRADGAPEPIHVEMHLRNLRWQVRRVWLPNALLEKASSGT